VVVLLAVGACASGLPLEDLDAARDAADCAWLTRCGYFDSTARCRADLASAFHPTRQVLGQQGDEAEFAPLRVTPSVRAAITAGSILYDSAQAEDCLAMIEATACNPGALERRLSLALCVGVFRGSRPIGSQCGLDVECASRNCVPEEFCDPATCCAGRCTSTRGVVGVQGACDSNACAPDATCDPATLVCVPLYGPGLACRGQAECAFGLVCIDTCQPPLPAGAPCALSSTGWACGGDVGCDLATLHCGARHPIGAACVPGLGHCVLDATCDPHTATCVPLPRIGEPCPGGACASEAWCAPLPPDGSICAARAPDGAQCAGDDRCASGACDNDGLCVTPPGCL
jgi:hypothetical protein